MINNNKNHRNDWNIYRWLLLLQPAIDVIDDVVLELAVYNWPMAAAVLFKSVALLFNFNCVKYSVKSSVDDWSGDWELRHGMGNGNKRAWSGCNKAHDGRRFFVLHIDGVGEPHGDGDLTPGKYAAVFGDGDAWIESIPESRACKWSLNDE